jgi:exodeoxyribonuclease V
MSVSLTEEQQRAVEAIVEWYVNGTAQEFYLAGYAGVGKSTVVNFAIAAIKARTGIETVYTAAYTGKAAHVLQTKGVAMVSTIHGLIYVPDPQEDGTVVFHVDASSPANKADLIILDECSMVNHEIARDLRSFKKKILVIGDPGQLPPVSGLGAFTSRSPDALLETIHRQSEGSPILHLATLARQGKPLPIGFDEGGVKVLRLSQDTQKLVYSPDTQTLCGLNKVRWNLTRRIRQRKGYSDAGVMRGETVICTRNDHDKGLFNGQIGIAENCDNDHGRGEYLLDFRDEYYGNLHRNLPVDPYQFKSNYTDKKEDTLYHNQYGALNEFDFGYVLTVHKAQGSSWDHVTVVDDSAFFRENARLWLYTALTRAEKGLTVLVR